MQGCWRSNDGGIQMALQLIDMGERGYPQVASDLLPCFVDGVDDADHIVDRLLG